MSDTVQDIIKNQFQNWDEKLAAEVLSSVDPEDDNLLDGLHLVQKEFGYVDKKAITMLAKLFNLSRAEVHGVVSFYEDFREEKPPAYVLKICQAESCQAMGSKKITTDIKEFLGIDFHETNSESDVSLEPVYCLGNCSCSPNTMINSTIISRTSTSELTEILQNLKSDG